MLLDTLSLTLFRLWVLEALRLVSSSVDGVSFNHAVSHIGVVSEGGLLGW